MRVSKGYVVDLVDQAAKAESGPPEMVMVDTLLESSTLCHLMKVSARTLGRLLDETDFPEPIYLTAQIKRWRASEYNAWIDHIRKDGGYMKRKTQRIISGKHRHGREEKGNARRDDCGDPA